jgi:hypothetical protein
MIPWSLHGLQFLLLAGPYLFATVTRAELSSCFFQNGTNVQDVGNPANEAILSCGEVSGQASMCCALNRTTSPSDICLSNGLCATPGNDTNTNDASQDTQYWVNSCTDKNWGAGCLNVCGNTVCTLHPRIWSHADRDYCHELSEPPCLDPPMYTTTSFTC